MTTTTRISVSGNIRVRASDIPPWLERRIQDRLTLANPAFRGALAAARMRGSKRRPKVDAHLPFFWRDGDDLLLPRGFGPELVAMLRKAGMRVEIDDRRATAPFEYPASPMLRSYQSAAVASMRRIVQAVGCHPCGAGKTWIGSGLIGRCAQRAAVLVPSHDIADQWRATIRQALGVKPGSLGDGGPVAVATIQSVLHARFDPSRALGYGTLLLDEAHHVPAESMFGALPLFPARHRFGLTATPERDDGLTRAIDFAIGPIAHRSTFLELAAGGWLTPPIIQPWDSGVDLGDSRSHGAALERIEADDERNRAIVAIARGEIERGRTTMVIAARKSHLERLARMAAGDGMPAALVFGSMTKRRRRAALGMIRDGRILLALATNGLADEGLDIPKLGAMVSASFGRARGKTVQRAGRLCRPSPGVDEPILHDIVDRGSLPGEHWDERRRAYLAEFGACVRRIEKVNQASFFR